VNAARYWLGLASTLHAVIIAWAAHVLPWRPAAPLALLLWLLALAHAAIAVSALAGLASWLRLWRLQAFGSLAAALILIGSMALGAERLVVMFGKLGWNLTALLGVIAVLVLGLTLPMGLWGVAATRQRSKERAPRTSADGPAPRVEIERPAATDVITTATTTLAGRPWAYLVGGCTLLAVLWPLYSGVDSFPLSNYPMFSRPRGQPVLFSVVASSSAGSEWSVPSALVGSDEVLQTKVLIQRAVDGGRAAMAELCTSVAGRISAQDLPRDPRSSSSSSGAADQPEFVDIVSRRYDPVQYFVQGPNPIEEQRLHRCSIAGVEPRRKARRRAE
jgi:hypothetical protein